MSKSIHYVEMNGRREGPFSTSQIKTLIKAGLVSADALPAADQNPLHQPVSNFSLVGWILTIGGVAAAVYFLMFFDVSVATPRISQEVLGIHRVNNLGLMQDRQNGLIISLFVAAVGVALLITGHLSSRRRVAKQSEHAPEREIIPSPEELKILLAIRAKAASSKKPSRRAP